MIDAPEPNRPPKPIRWLIGSVVYVGAIGWVALGLFDDYVGLASPRVPNRLTGQVVAATWKSATIYVYAWQAPLMNSMLIAMYLATWAIFTFALGPWAYPQWRKPHPPRWRPIF